MLDWHSCQICYPLEIKILLYSCFVVGLQIMVFNFFVSNFFLFILTVLNLICRLV